MDWLSPVREILGAISPILERLSVVRAVLGFILVFFLPGFAWTFIFFRRIDIIERIALSFALSISLVTLSLLILNRLIGVRITGFNAVLVIVVITIVPLAAYYVSRFVGRKGANAT